MLLSNIVQLAGNQDNYELPKSSRKLQGLKQSNFKVLRENRQIEIAVNILHRTYYDMAPI